MINSSLDIRVFDSMSVKGVVFWKTLCLIGSLTVATYSGWTKTKPVDKNLVKIL